jgi:GNAT superfamily N-acetyltransferase
MSAFKIVTFLPQHSQAAVNLWRQAHSQALGLESIHSVESQTYFLQHILPQDYDIQVVLDTDTVVAFMASNRNEISQLYVHPEYQGKGIGSLLMEVAKQQSDGYLSLRTFEKNQPARDFY